MVIEETQPSLKQLFRQQFPYYLSIGMSKEDFWHGTPALAKYYREAEYLRMQKEQTMLWYAGIYVRSAIASTLSDGKHSAPKYPNKPFDVVPKTKAQKEVEVIRERQKIVDYFNIMKLNWKKRGSTDNG